jgi:hypothetical protein
LRGARRLTYADPHMRNLLLALLHLAVVTAKLCGSGGVRAVMAENLLLKQQLIVLWRLGLIRFRGHFPKGGYDVHNGRQTAQAYASEFQ